MFPNLGEIIFSLLDKVYCWDSTDQHDCSCEVYTDSCSGSSDLRDGLG